MPFLESRDRLKCQSIVFESCYPLARFRLYWIESSSSLFVIGKPAEAIFKTQSTIAFSSSDFKQVSLPLLQETG